MTISLHQVLSSEMIERILQLPDVQSHKLQVDKETSGSVYFSIQLDEDLRTQIQDAFGISLQGLRKIPMRWIKGDTKPHIDRGSDDFDHTYLVYLTDSPGQFVVGDETYAITQGAGFVFQEGIRHEAKDTGNRPRLLLGHRLPIERKAEA